MWSLAVDELLNMPTSISERWCTVVSFARRRKLANLKTIQISAEVMEFKQEVKFLGMKQSTFRKLSVKPQWLGGVERPGVVKQTF